MTWDTINDLQTFDSEFTPATVELKEGQSLGENKNYCLEKNLGSGGMGEVWLASEIRGGQEIRKVVVKTLRPDRRGNEGEQEKALQQFKLIQTLNHTNICPIYVIEKDPACGYLIVMGYANGGSYADWFTKQPKQNGGLPLKTVCEVLRPIADALDHAHKFGVIHRDVKPENMMFTQLNGVQTSWLIDFGIAANLRAAAQATTGQFSQSGTVSYMAPEQRKGELQTAQTDEYALALVALEFLTGTTFLQAVQVLQLEIQRVLNKALALKPSNRFSTCQEFIDALARTLTVIPPPVPPTSKATGTTLPASSKSQTTSNLKDTGNVITHPKSIIEQIVESERQVTEAKRLAEKEFLKKKIQDIEKSVTVEYQSGHYTQAIEYLNELLKLKPDHPNAQYLLSSCKEKQKIQQEEAKRKASEEIERKKRFITVPTDCSLEEACMKAVERAFITIKPGKYRLSQSIDLAKNIVLQGETKRAKDVIIDCPSFDNFQITGGSPTFQNLTISCGAENCNAFYITGGTPKLSRCIIISRKGDGIWIKGENANPQIELCAIKDCGSSGLVITESARGEFRKCEIYRNIESEIIVTTSANPTFTECKIHNGEEDGIFVSENGLGKFNNCEIFGNLLSGIHIESFGNPTVTGCKIHDGEYLGVFVLENGLGTFRDCEIYGNMESGFLVAKSGNPTVTKCIIHDGHSAGVAISNNGFGEFKGCEIYGNEDIGIYVDTAGNPTITECSIHDGKKNGVVVHNYGIGLFKDCEIYGNEDIGIIIKTSGNPIFNKCKIHEGKAGGVFIFEKGIGTFQDCEIYGNVLSGICVSKSGNPTVTRCIIHDEECGVFVYENGFGTFRDCEIYGNEEAGIMVLRSGNPTVTKCKIRDGRQRGVYISEGGMGTFNNNLLVKNFREGKLSNWVIDTDAGKVKGSGNSPEIPDPPKPLWKKFFG